MQQVSLDCGRKKKTAPRDNMGIELVGILEIFHNYYILGYDNSITIIIGERMSFFGGRTC